MGVVWCDVRHRLRRARPPTWKVRGGQRRRPRRRPRSEVARSCPSPTSCPTAESSSRPTPSWPSSSRRPRRRAPDARRPARRRARARRAAAGRPARRWTLLATSDPQTGEAQAAAVGLRGRRAQALRGADRLRGPQRVQLRRQGRARRRRQPARPGLVQGQADRHVAVRPPDRTTRSSRCSRSSRRRPTPGEAPPLPEADETQPVDLGDHGPRPRRQAPAVGRRHASSPAIVFGGLLQHASTGGTSVVAARRARPPPERREPAWASTCRSSPCWSSAVALRGAQPRRVEAAGAAQPDAGQVGALRVRHRARAGSRPSASRCASTSWR